ncbi:hypothetical protein AAHA92_21842 [Salvia divinorum]|uniref:Uncharacterized protein n=1 Tax=Salvia divinorum TaxID=28513 RepID=A0ABD1GM29_SALDI
MRRARESRRESGPRQWPEERKAAARESKACLGDGVERVICSGIRVVTNSPSDNSAAIQEIPSRGGNGLCNFSLLLNLGKRHNTTSS